MPAGQRVQVVVEVVVVMMMLILVYRGSSRIAKSTQRNPVSLPPSPNKNSQKGQMWWCQRLILALRKGTDLKYKPAW